MWLELVATDCWISLWSSQAQNKIDEMTRLDREIYEAGRIHFEKVGPADFTASTYFLHFNGLCVPYKRSCHLVVNTAVSSYRKPTPCFLFCVLIFLGAMYSLCVAYPRSSIAQTTASVFSDRDNHCHILLYRSQKRAPPTLDHYIHPPTKLV